MHSKLDICSERLSLPVASIYDGLDERCIFENSIDCGIHPGHRQERRGP